MKTETMKVWHEIIQTSDITLLDSLLADDATFHSPLIHTPQKGKEITKLYLLGAMHVLLNDSFHYPLTIVGERDAALEFLTKVDGIEINGIDLISWDENGKIKDFKVMLRPMKAINLVREKMAAFLEKSN